LAVYRLYGVTSGIVALIAFGLAYHEPGAARLTWLFLLMPIALLRVVRDGAGEKWILAWKYFATALLLLCLIPFVARQLQGAIYPQLETPGIAYGSRTIFGWPIVGYAPRVHTTADSQQSLRQSSLPLTDEKAEPPGMTKLDRSNLLYDPKSRIQTGPAEPTWNWHDVSCIWNGPVTSHQQIKPMLISLPEHRVLTILRVVLLMVLAAILLGKPGKIRLGFFRRRTKMASLLAVLLLPGITSAQIPNKELLETLRQRLLESPDVFPNVAEIPSAELTIDENRIEIKARIHAALDVAVPIPGRLPAWSPVSVMMDGQANVLASRRDGFLWVLIPKGVHDVTVKGLLSDDTDWEWTFLLKPKYVSITAPGWKVTGVTADGVPDPQVFFVRERDATEETAAYDRLDFNPIVVVDRYLEIGLVSKIHNTVTRLSQPGKAVSLDVPLLDGEGVLTSSRDVSDGSIAVRLGATQNTFDWDSELPAGAGIELRAQPTDRWVERWHLVTSPVWNVTLAGLRPVFEAGQQDLIPFWRPWPGESATMTFSKPVAVTGDTVTVRNVHHETSLGSRRRTSNMILDLECSLASDFVVELDSQAEIVSLQMNKNAIPVQRDGASLIIPARPGKHNVAIAWKTPEVMDTTVTASKVKFPGEASNVTTVMTMPENRWILWADGPLRGPAVRFWTILAIAILVGLALGSTSLSPLRRWEWVLLAIGLTQVHLIAAMTVVGWLFLLAWRGDGKKIESRVLVFNLLQLGIIVLTFAALIILVFVVGAGLLGNPDMFIIGNGSSRTFLQWFQPRSGPEFPMPYVVSISVWFYRLLMLFWALWLASALLRWLQWGWQQFSCGGLWRRTRKPEIEVPGDPV